MKIDKWDIITWLAIFGIIILVIVIHIGITSVWNNIMPRVFGLPIISGWDLLGLMCIASWIFPKPMINNKKK